MGSNRLKDLQVAARQLAKSLRELSAGELSVNDLKALTGMLKELTGVLRNLYELPTQAEAEAQRIARLRSEEDKGVSGVEIRLEGLEELGR